MRISHRQTWKIVPRYNHAAHYGAIMRHSISMNAKGQVFAATYDATMAPAKDSVHTQLKGFKYAD